LCELIKQLRLWKLIEQLLDKLIKRLLCSKLIVLPLAGIGKGLGKNQESREQYMCNMSWHHLLGKIEGKV